MPIGRMAARRRKLQLMEPPVRGGGGPATKLDLAEMRADLKARKLRPEQAKEKIESALVDSGLPRNIAMAAAGIAALELMEGRTEQAARSLERARQINGEEETKRKKRGGYGF